MEGKLIIVIEENAPARVALCEVTRETAKFYYVKILRPDNFWLVPNKIQGIDSEHGPFIDKRDVFIDNATEQDYEHHRVV